MPRRARDKREGAIYHVMARGNNREPIFFCDDDRIRYLDTLKRYKEKYKLFVYSYCLMDNHIHIIIDSNGQDISKIMQGITLSYTIYMNRVYGRCGHLFQGRFTSEIIDNDNYILAASKYIHYNPVKAGIVDKESEYKWSSFNIYMGKQDTHEIIDEDYILGYFNEDRTRARELFAEFTDIKDKDFVPKVENIKYVSSDKKVKIRGEKIENVLKKVSRVFEICLNDITTKYTRKYVKIKQITAYLISLKSRLNHNEIGRKLGLCGSTIGKHIKSAIQVLMKDIEKRRIFELILNN